PDCQWAKESRQAATAGAVTTRRVMCRDRIASAFAGPLRLLPLIESAWPADTRGLSRDLPFRSRPVARDARGVAIPRDITRGPGTRRPIRSAITADPVAPEGPIPTPEIRGVATGGGRLS